MSIIFIGYKCGMTSFFDSSGFFFPASVVKIYSNYVVDVKPFSDTMSVVKVSACSVDKRKVSKSIIGFYDKIGLNYFKYMTEFKIASDKFNYSIGDILPLSLFNSFDKIDVIGTSKGRGFAGVIKRHNFKSQGASHGNSLSHRVPGSIGQCQTPGRVFKGKKMPGRMGNVNVTVKNIGILNICNDSEVLLLKGAIPGAVGSKILLRKKC
jgi:large subunit ribosomal protein L3